MASHPGKRHVYACRRPESGRLSRASNSRPRELHLGSRTGFRSARIASAAVAADHPKPLAATGRVATARNSVRWQPQRQHARDSVRPQVAIASSYREAIHSIVEVLTPQGSIWDGGSFAFRQSGHPFMKRANPLDGRTSLRNMKGLGDQAQDLAFLFHAESGVRTRAQEIRGDLQFALRVGLQYRRFGHDSRLQASMAERPNTLSSPFAHPTARSAIPSPLKSPTATVSACAPWGRLICTALWKRTITRIRQQTEAVGICHNQIQVGPQVPPLRAYSTRR